MQSLIVDTIGTVAVTGGIYQAGKLVLDSIWDAYLTFLGESGLLGEEDVQNGIYHLMNK